MWKILLYHPDTFNKYEAEITSLADGKYFLCITNLSNFDLVFHNQFQTDSMLTDALVQLCEVNGWRFVENYISERMDTKAFEDFYDCCCR